MQWFFPTATFRAMSGQGEGLPGSEADEAFASQWGDGVGAEIMGANKFGPPGWQDDADWKGWWGEEPPFHTPVIVLTHRPRPSVEMAGGTTFHFRDASIEDALAEARELADGRDVRIGGGVAVARAYLAAGLVDHLHVAVSPILLGRGERLWDGLEGLESGYEVSAVTTPSGVTHVTYDR
jgi:dihydrofolate reductase